MKINLVSKNMDITPAIHDYVVKRVTNLGKLLSRISEKGGEVFVDFEVSKKTNHKSGDVFHSDCHIKFDGKSFYASSDKDDLYASIDEVKEILFQDIDREKDKKQTLFRRGAKSVKKILKGVSSRNPFTSK